MNNKPVIIASKYEPLECEVCKKDLLETGRGFVGYVSPWYVNGAQFTDVHWGCKGDCLRTVQFVLGEHRCSLSWSDLDFYATPQGYLRMSQDAHWKSFQGELTKEAFEKINIAILKLAQITVREPTAAERQNFDEYYMWH